MKKILMLFIAVSLAYSCKSTKASNSNVAANETAVEKKLQQTWILDNLNGKTVTTKDFSKLPEIQMASASFSGSTGCNAVKGTLVSSAAGKLQFPTVTSETKKCDAKKEGEFLQLLRTTSGYSVENNTLYLSNQFGLTMSFKKK